MHEFEAKFKLRKGPIHMRHFGTQYCDKKILQLKDKKTFFCQNMVVSFQNIFKPQAPMSIFCTNSSIHRHLWNIIVQK